MLPKPREDDRAGEARAPSQPLSTEKGAATIGDLVPSSTAFSSFLFFAEGDSLIKQQRSVKDKQQKQEQGKNTYWSTAV